MNKHKVKHHRKFDTKTAYRDHIRTTALERSVMNKQCYSINRKSPKKYKIKRKFTFSFGKYQIYFILFVENIRIFTSSAVRSHKTLIFFMKRGMSLHLYSDQWSSHGVLLRSYGVLVGNSLPSHDAFTALLGGLTTQAQPFHNIHTALTAC